MKSEHDQPASGQRDVLHQGIVTLMEELTHIRSEIASLRSELATRAPKPVA